jgi:hypothetical protein
MNKNLDQLLDLWTNDDGFRAAFDRCPESACADAGIQLSGADLDSIRPIAEMSARQLDARVSSGGIGITAYC